MSTVAQLPPPAVRWDLSGLFESPSDPAIDAVWESVKVEAEKFAETYRGRINVPDLERGRYRSVSGHRGDDSGVRQAGGFAELSFVTDTNNPSAGAFLQKQLEKGTELNVTLMFFELEIQALAEPTVDRLLADPAMETYQHHLVVTRSFSPYRLSEPEEIILEEAANTGSRAWVRLFEEITQTRRTSCVCLMVRIKN